MKRSIPYTITSEYEQMTIDAFIRSRGFSHAVRTALKHTKEGILLNGVWSYTSTKLQTGDTLTLTIDETEVSENIVPAALDMSILYEDEDLLVVNKSAGMPIHPSQNNYDNTLANAVAHYYKEENIPFVFRCINRLDRDTTGVTVIAKNLFSSSVLYPAAAKHQIKRSYLAVVSGHLDHSGTIDAPIARVDDSTILRCVREENGERAITHYQPLQYATLSPSASKSDAMTLFSMQHDADVNMSSFTQSKKEYTLVSLQLETGRTHQIRVHMKYLGFPLIGDYLYHPDYTLIHRVALHSASIDFLHPITGNPMHFEAPLPKDMRQIFS